MSAAVVKSKLLTQSLAALLSRMNGRYFWRISGLSSLGVNARERYDTSGWWVVATIWETVEDILFEYLGRSRDCEIAGLSVEGTLCTK